MMSWQSVAGIVAATFAGCAGVITWLDARAKRMLSEATDDLRQRVNALETRVQTLENGNKEARIQINKAMVLAAKGGYDDIVGFLEAADASLH